MSISPKKLAKLSDRDYRQSYLKETVTSWVVHQIKQLRKDRDWSQADLGERAGNKPQSTIARFESADYGNWSTASLLELADAFDVALDIRFVGWPAFVEKTGDTSPGAMSVPSFSVTQFNSVAGNAGTSGITYITNAQSSVFNGTTVQSWAAVGIATGDNGTAVKVISQTDFFVPNRVPSFEMKSA